MSIRIQSVILTAINGYRNKEPVLRIIRFRETLLALLISVILLSMWSRSNAALFCPHMMGGDCCIAQKTESDCHDVHHSGSLATHDIMDHMHMSEMEMEMSPSDMKMDDTATPLLTFDPDLSYNAGSQIGTQVTSEAISGRREPCSHCEMHSRSTATFPVSVAGQTNLSYQIIAPHAATATLKSVLLVPAFFDLHEHGPPGSSASPVYILVSAFRI